MTEVDRINQVFALLERAKSVDGVGDLKSFHFSWDMARTATGEPDLLPSLHVEYWAKPTV